MLGKLMDKILHDEEEVLEKIEEVEKKVAYELKHDKKEIAVVLLLLLAAFIYRIWFIYGVSGPDNAGAGWYGDTYHHWQIAYLSHTTGFHNGFLRLWDLKGMEFFWGLAHPLIMTIVFIVTSSFEIVLTRFVSIYFGIGSILLIYLISRRYWGRKIAYAALFFGSFFPVVVFNDTTGSLEELGVFFLLLGVYLWPKYALFAGLSWVFAAMSRAEAWLFALIMLFGVVISKERADKKALAVIGWVVPMLVYMKYILNYTGNAIYPVYWNFLANALGKWADVVRPLSETQLFVRPILIGVAAVALIASVVVIVKRPKSVVFLLLGLGNIVFVGSFMGLTHYLTGWEWWFPVIRFFVFPYMFVAVLVMIVVERIRIGNHKMWTVWFGYLVVLITLASQITWIPIMARFDGTVGAWNRAKLWGSELGVFYKGGNVLFPEHDPDFTYAAVKFGHLKGENIVSQMYDPFFYIGEDTAFADWGKYRKDVLTWLSKNEFTLAVIRHDATRYKSLIAKEPSLFVKLGSLTGDTYEIWQVLPPSPNEINTPPSI